MYNRIAMSRVAPERMISHHPDIAFIHFESNAREALMIDLIQDCVKVCKVHGQLTSSQVYKQKNAKAKMGFYYSCKACVTCDRFKRSCKKHGELTKEQRSSHGDCKLCKSDNEKKRIGANPEYFRKKRSDDIKNNPEKWAECYKRNYVRERAKLTTKQIKDQALDSSLRKFRVSINDYRELEIAQNYRCKICGNEETAKSRTEGQTRRLSIDHCHETGKIRGLLCHLCNVMLGNAKDSIEILHLAIIYLEENGVRYAIS